MFKKKLVCIMMAMVMMVGLLPLTALAANAPNMTDFISAGFAAFGTSTGRTDGAGGVLLEFKGDQQGEIKLSDIKDITFSVNGVATKVELREIEKYPYAENSSTIYCLKFTQDIYGPGRFDFSCTYQNVRIQAALMFNADGTVDSVDTPSIPATPSTPATVTVTATPTASTVLVNGKQVGFDAYTINGNNYFKLRDLAYTLSGSEKQFEVSWDGANNSIALTSGKPYTAVGGEMTGKGAGNKTGTPTSSKIYLNGKEVTFTAYTIDGNNYFKLRDIGKAFDIFIGWDGKDIHIGTDKGYDYDNEGVNATPPSGANVPETGEIKYKLVLPAPDNYVNVFYILTDKPLADVKASDITKISLSVEMSAFPGQINEQEGISVDSAYDATNDTSYWNGTIWEYADLEKYHDTYKYIYCFYVAGAYGQFAEYGYTYYLTVDFRGITLSDTAYSSPMFVER